MKTRVSFPEHRIHPLDARLSLVHILVGFVGIFLGAICGVLQGLVRGGLIELPRGIDYYQILTAHGILLAIVFTTYFIFGFFFAGISRTLGQLSREQRSISWLGFMLMTGGSIVITIMVLLNKASVLYTFYAPLAASFYFYLGLALFIVGSLCSSLALLIRYISWKKTHPNQLSPLLPFMVVATLLLWIIACIGVVLTVVFQLIPWSLGWVPTINVLLSRTLFWYFGHPLVYFWLLPAYIAWYICIPKIIGGKLFSDSLARLAFVLFLLFSIPVGFHHQLMESGISEFWKYTQVVLTFMVIIPSLLTAFSLFATFEAVGRAKGGSGLFGWFTKLPYRDVRFLAPFVGMLFFIPAGIGGIINASYQLNAVVHNTLWVVGHFHITVGTAVVLTFFGIAYWLIPYLTGRTLTPLINRLGLIQTSLWAVGMLIMSSSMHILGIAGSPRRTAYTTYGDHPVALSWFEGFLSNHVTMAVGGVLLFISAMLMCYLVIHLAYFAPKQSQTELAVSSEKEHFPIAQTMTGTEHTPRFLENWRLWVAIVALLILFAYTVPILDMIIHTPAGSPPFRTW